MAIAKQLRPVDVETQRLLAEAIDESGFSQERIRDATGISQNRISIIVRRATPPATVGEICAIAHAVGASGSEIIREAERLVAVEQAGSDPSEWAFAAQHEPGIEEDEAAL